MEEVWKQINNFPNYEISNFGRIKHYGKLINTISSLKGYVSVGLYNGKNNKGERFLLHRLVAKHFVDNPNNYNIVNHKDENKANNRADNLEWCTTKYNCNYGNRNIICAERVSKPVKCIFGNKVALYKSGAYAANCTNVSQSGVAQVLIGKRKSCFGAVFKYATKEEIELLNGEEHYGDVIDLTPKNKFKFKN